VLSNFAGKVGSFTGAMAAILPIPGDCDHTLRRVGIGRHSQDRIQRLAVGGEIRWLSCLAVGLCRRNAVV
jgi:hypothetical protein